MEQAEA